MLGIDFERSKNKAEILHILSESIWGPVVTFSLADFGVVLYRYSLFLTNPSILCSEFTSSWTWMVVAWGIDWCFWFSNNSRAVCSFHYFSLVILGSLHSQQGALAAGIVWEKQRVRGRLSLSRQSIFFPLWYHSGLAVGSSSSYFYQLGWDMCHSYSRKKRNKLKPYF